MSEKFKDLPDDIIISKELRDIIKKLLR